MKAAFFIISFLVLCAAISVTYGALKFDEARKIRNDAVHTFVYFVIGIVGLALFIAYISR